MRGSTKINRELRRGNRRIDAMAAIARYTIVMLTAVPMLASPGWCCVSWTGGCGDATPSASAVSSSSSSASRNLAGSLPSCCARRAKTQGQDSPLTLERLARRLQGHCPAVGYVEAPVCSCCNESQAIAISVQAKEVRATSPLLLWTASTAPELGALASTPVDNGVLQSGRPSLQVLQCVWRC